MLYKRIVFLWFLYVGVLDGSAESVHYFIRNKKNNASVLVLYPNQTYAYFIQKPQGYKKDSGTYRISQRRKTLKLMPDAVLGISHDLVDVSCYWQGETIIDDLGTILLKTIQMNDSLLKSLRQPKVKPSSTKSSLTSIQTTLIQTNTYAVKLLPSNDSWYTKVQHYDPNYVNKANALADTLYRHELEERREYNTITPGKIKIYQLAKSLTQNFKSDSLKVMALANWIVRNFHYDLNGPVDPESLLTVKATRCQGYADFMTEMCLGINLPCLTIIGYADNFMGNRVFDKASTNHAWNIVKVKGQWRLIDVTWLDPVGGVGNSVNGQSDYFLSHPLDFLYDHMPYEPAFKFTNLRESNIVDFSNSPIRIQKKEDLQFLAPLQTVQYLSDTCFTFYIYSKRKNTIKCEYIDTGYWIALADIPLQAGVNKISLKLRPLTSQLYFSNEDISVRFKMYSKQDPQKLFKEAMSEDNSLYTQQFYAFLSQQIKSPQLTIDPKLPEALKEPSLWENVLYRYNGRLPATNLFSYSETKALGKGKTQTINVLEYRFFLSGLQIKGQDVFVKALIQCPFDKYLKSEEQQCPLSQMVFSLKDPTKW